MTGRKNKVKRKTKVKKKSLQAAIILKQKELADILDKARQNPNSFEGQNRGVLVSSHNKKLREMKNRLSAMN
jgi:hypothetical protein